MLVCSTYNPPVSFFFAVLLLIDLPTGAQFNITLICTHTDLQWMVELQSQSSSLCKLYLANKTDSDIQIKHHTKTLYISLMN